MKDLNPTRILALAAVLFVSALTCSAEDLSENALGNYQFGLFSSWQPAGSSERVILDLINDFRRQKHLRALIADPELNRVARSYSAKMAREDFFGHYDAKGNNLTNRVKDSNILWTAIAENLYFCQGFDDPEQAAVKGWLKSPAHRANLLSRSWSATGIGVAEAADGRFYATQIFIRR